MEWIFPIEKIPVGVTYDSMSFVKLQPYQVEIPVGHHVGAFGSPRKHDVHKGVDLYCEDCCDVYAVDDGFVRQIRWFTGEKAGCPWWNDTQAITIELANGTMVVYGEVTPIPNLRVGDFVEGGQCIANVRTVLKKDKGRPTSMLHFAMHSPGVLSNGVWELGKPQPVGLVDPTNYLLRATNLGRTK